MTKMGIVVTGLAMAAFGLVCAAPSPASASLTGSCKDVSLKFTNGGRYPIDIATTGHRVKNPGSIEGWNKLTLNTAKSGLAAGANWSSEADLNVSCKSDLQFEIHWNDSAGYHVKTFTSKDATDKNVAFTLDY